jgi:hypothetical protein
LHNVLGWRDVQNGGQGFADEVFRVFARAHPEIEIRAINASSAVNAMLRHIQSFTTGTHGNI